MQNATTKVLFRFEDSLIIVDPGASTAARSHLEQILLKYVNLPSLMVYIFLTHHHKDHCEGLDVVHSLLPNATLVGHPNTLKRVESPLKKLPLSSAHKLFVSQGKTHS